MLTNSDVLLSTLFARVFSHVIQIDRLTGQAAVLYASGDGRIPPQGASFEYAPAIRKYLLQVSSDSDPYDILSRLELERVEEALKHQDSFQVHFTTRGADQAFRLQEICFFPLNSSHLIMTFRDITEAFRSVYQDVERLEKALRTARLEADRRNSFLTLLSRSIRTPLYSIMGLTHIAREDGINAIENDDYLRKISMSGSYMKDTIDDVLELRQIATEEIVLKSDLFRLEQLTERLQKHLVSYLQEKGLVLSVSLPAEELPDLVSDRRCMSQILKNLVRCVAASTVKGGRITLNVRELFRSKNRVTLEFSAESRGVVFNQEHLSALFRPFDYLLETVDDSLGEIDISLLILKRYLQAMRIDTLTAESQEGKGSRLFFSATFPCASGDEKKEHSEPSLLLPDLSGKRALLVDDNHISLEIGLRLLRARGAEVLTAEDGREAVECFRSENGRFDLIFMDVLMPVMDGLEAARRIRAMEDVPKSGTVPIVAMTANAFLKNFEESFRAGMNAHLVKPIEPEQFYQVIREQLGI